MGAMPLLFSLGPSRAARSHPLLGPSEAAPEAVSSPGLPSTKQGATGEGPAEATKMTCGLEHLLGRETAGAGPV